MSLVSLCYVSNWVSLMQNTFEGNNDDSSIPCVQRPGTRYTAATLTASLVPSRLSSWERPTTPAPQMDAQMGSSGALPLQSTRKTSSTLSVPRRMVRLFVL